MKKSFLFVFILVFFLCFTAAQVLAGFKASLSQSALTYLKTVGLVLLREKIKEVHVPDQKGKVSSPVGKIEWSITNIRVYDIQLPAAEIRIVSGGIYFAVVGLRAQTDFKWKWKRSPISDSGSGHIEFSCTSGVDLGITAQNQRPHVTTRSAKVDIGTFKIKLKGGASWFYQIIVDLFKSSIKKEVESAMKSALVSAINSGVNSAFAKLPIQVPVNSKIGLNYGLVANPIFTQFFTLPDKGEFYNLQHYDPCKHCKQPPIPDAATNRMLQLSISDYMLNTLTDVFHKNGDLKVIVKDKDLPNWTPIRLTTQSFKSLLPKMYEKFPDKYLQMHIYSTESPIFTMKPNGITLVTIGELKMLVEMPNGLEHAFTLAIRVGCSGIAFLVDNKKVAGNLTFVNMDAKVKDSAIGAFDVSLLRDLINLLFAKGLVPLANEFLKRGFDLPLFDDITIVNPSIQWGEAYFAVGTDFRYRNIPA
jgi:lipopolysaccharide-binding protein